MLTGTIVMTYLCMSRWIQSSPKTFNTANLRRKNASKWESAFEYLYLLKFFIEFCILHKQPVAHTRFTKFTLNILIDGGIQYIDMTYCPA